MKSMIRAAVLVALSLVQLPREVHAQADAQTLGELVEFCEVAVDDAMDRDTSGVPDAAFKMGMCYGHMSGAWYTYYLLLCDTTQPTTPMTMLDVTRSFLAWARQHPELHGSHVAGAGVWIPEAMKDYCAPNLASPLNPG